MIYYIDSQNGCDCRNGQSPETAWNSLEKVNATTFLPGDQILFCADCVFCGQLHPLGDGTPEQPIRIGRYGEGKKPCIDGCGSHGTKAGNYTDGAAVLFYNQNYWEMQDLDITNCNPNFRQPFEYVVIDGWGNRMLPSPENRYRYGILIRWHNYGTGHHIHIRNCDIHDVHGEMNRFTSDGILAVSTGTVDGVPTNFDDLLLENNTLTRISRTGISVWSGWAEGRGIDYRGDQETTANYYHCTVGPWKGSTNVVIRGNRISYTAGDGILLNTTKDALIEKNYVEHACYEMRIGANAAVWPHNADGTIMQENEVCFTHGVMDGQAFDIDYACHDTIIRNNYTHDNEGGFLLLMDNIWNSLICNNISENDCNGLIWLNGNKGGSVFRDNLFYMGMENSQVFRGPWGSADVTFENNTFMCREPGTQIQWKTEPTYKGNNYYNIASLPNDPEARQEKPDFTPSR